jgi:hypothetical protein
MKVTRPNGDVLELTPYEYAELIRQERPVALPTWQWYPWWVSPQISYTTTSASSTPEVSVYNSCCTARVTECDDHNCSNCATEER